MVGGGKRWVVVAGREGWWVAVAGGRIVIRDVISHYYVTGMPVNFVTGGNL